MTEEEITKDNIKTREINILVSENRALTAENATLKEKNEEMMNEVAYFRSRDDAKWHKDFGEKDEYKTRIRDLEAKLTLATDTLLFYAQDKDSRAAKALAQLSQEGDK